MQCVYRFNILLAPGGLLSLFSCIAVILNKAVAYLPSAGDREDLVARTVLQVLSYRLSTSRISAANLRAA